jgi:hypothetical protein
MKYKCNKTNVCKTIRTLDVDCMHAKHHDQDLQAGCGPDTCDTEQILCECKPVRHKRSPRLLSAEDYH